MNRIDLNFLKEKFFLAPKSNYYRNLSRTLRYEMEYCSERLKYTRFK